MGLGIGREKLDVDDWPDYYNDLSCSYGRFNQIRENLGETAGFDMSDWQAGKITVSSTHAKFGVHKILPLLLCSHSSAVFRSDECRDMVKPLELLTIQLEGFEERWFSNFVKVLYDCMEHDDKLIFC